MEKNDDGKRKCQKYQWKINRQNCGLRLDSTKLIQGFFPYQTKECRFRLMKMSLLFSSLLIWIGKIFFFPEQPKTKWENFQIKIEPIISMAFTLPVPLIHPPNFYSSF